MSKIVQIRPGSLGEVEIRRFLVAVHDAYWPEAPFEFDLGSYPRKLSTLAEGVAVRDSEGALGAVALGYVNDFDTHRGFISYIARLPEAPVSGRLVHEAFLELARLRGMAEIWLEVLATNARARAFYGRLGYRQIEDHGARLLLTKML